MTRPVSSETRYCPNCKSTILIFNPPVEIEPYEPCGIVKPGNHATGEAPVCFEPKGHDGGHIAVIEYLERWP